MLARALLIWCVLLGLAVLNGAVREAVIVPRTGAVAGHAISTVTLCVLILLLSWAAITWVRPLSTRHALAVGGLWVALTVAFEFLAGHYLLGTSWRRLLEDYNVLRGRIWPLALVTAGASPWLTARVRGLL